MTVKEIFKNNIPRSILILLLYFIYAIAGTTSAYLTKYALNAITAKQLNNFIYWELLSSLIEIITVILVPIVTTIFTRQIQDYLHKIRQDIMKHYYGQHDEKVSTMQNNLTENLKILAADYATPWITIFSGLLEIIFSVGILLSMSWILIVTTAVLAVITLSLPKIMEKKTSGAKADMNKKNEQLLNTVDHWLGGLKELHRYNAYVRLQKQIQKSSAAYVKASKKTTAYISTSSLINGIGNILAQLVLAGVAGVLFFNNIISFGSWVVASGFAFTIFEAIWNITDAITKIKSTKKLRKDTSKLRQPIQSIEKIPAYGVKVANLAVQYKHGETITYPDFTIMPGQKVLLTGDSGTGKSTLFRTLLGDLTPSKGKVTFLDKDGQEIEAGKAKVGNLPQDPFVFPVSIKDNITMFNQKLANRVETIAQSVQLAPDLAKMPAGLETQVDLKTENLSGGQRQKVVLARSEIHKQPFVLMDEVTSAIDQEATERILDNLLKTKQTILMIAHNFTPEMRAKFDQEIKLTVQDKEDEK